MKQILLVALVALFMFMNLDKINAQGCVAIRSTGGVCSTDHSEQMDTLSKWSLNVNNRYFKSFRHFVGTKEQKQRVDQGTEVINHSYTMDVSLTYNINKWWSIAVDAPIVANTRSSLYEHDGKSRFSTSSFGR